MPYRNRAHSKLPLSLFIAFTLVACSDDGGSASLAGLGVDDGAREGLTKSATISAEKGGTISLDTGAKLEIPGGAVSSNVEVSMERPADRKALDLVNRLPKAADRIASAPYVLTPHGTKFEEDVTVTLPLSNKGARQVSAVWLEDEDDDVWKVLSAATVDGETASVKIKHFSVLLLVDDTSGLAQLDAGTGSDGEDAGDVEADAGAETPDADGPDVETDADVTAMDADVTEMDAGVMLEPDAGTNQDTGGSVVDASAGGPDASEPADADPGTDAQQQPDGSVSVDGSVIATTLQQRLVDCDLMIAQGFVSEPVTPDPVSHCRYHCLLAGECLDVQSYYCTGGDTSYSVATEACMLNCEPSAFTCPDQTTGNFRCDGALDCANGEDEAGCDPPYFQCPAGSRLPSYRRCDRVPDCQNGEDESGCSWHFCDGDVVLPPDVVCDGVTQCSDLSDENGSCASVNCSITTAQ